MPIEGSKEENDVLKCQIWSFRMDFLRYINRIYVNSTFALFDYSIIIKFLIENAVLNYNVVYCFFFIFTPPTIDVARLIDTNALPPKCTPERTT